MLGSRFITCLLASIFACSASLADPVTFNCEYQAFSDEEGLHKAEKPFLLTFLVDSEAKKAYVLGNNGSAEVLTVWNSDGVTLIEVTGVGNVMVTVITSKGPSVHSRNGIILGDLLPSQHYGACAKR